MLHRRLSCLVASIAAITGLSSALSAGLSAADTASPFALSPGIGANSGPQRLVFVHGLVDLDAWGSGNTTDGNDDLKDADHTTRFRSELGVRIELDERIETKLTVAYQSNVGSYDASDAENNVVMDDAYVVLKEFFNQPNLSLRAGRMPVSWNLRSDHGAFLFDSRANYPVVTSWDGGRIQWSIETLVFTPYAYALPDSSNLYGLVVDWQPEQAADSGLFLTGQISLNQDAVTYDRIPESAGGVEGDQLITWQGGFEVRLDNWDIYAEGGLQSGDADNDRSYGGYAVYGGVEWHPRTSYPQAYTLQYDWLKGDNNPDDDTLRYWVNPWEGQEDTLLVENEKYGEIAHYVDQAGYGRRGLKVSGDWGLDPRGMFRLKAVYGYYKLDVGRGGSKDLGHEGDLIFTWQYNKAGNTLLSLFASGFLPGDGYASVASTPGGAADAGTDTIYLFGANLTTAF